MKVALTLLNFCFALLVRANITGGTVPEALLSWDNASIIVRGERIMFLSAEFHPFRLPSPGLWLDVFQKVKAMGFSGVSFYVMWALVEGERGQIRTDGVFDLKGFFEAAKQAGIYLLARPGPYINSEVSGGGFPGWLQRNRGVLRTTAPDFLEASQTYIQHIGKLISEAEITKGGPVIMFQPENEFTFCLENGTTSAGACVDREHMEWVEKEYRKAGITVPFISNDGVPMGNFVPGSGTGEVDIYGFDYYPFGWASLKCKLPDEYLVRNLTFT
jgi:beta-galactosidase